MLPLMYCILAIIDDVIYPYSAFLVAGGRNLCLEFLIRQTLVVGSAQWLERTDETLYHSHSQVHRPEKDQTHFSLSLCPLCEPFPLACLLNLTPLLFSYRVDRGDERRWDEDLLHLVPTGSPYFW